MGKACGQTSGSGTGNTQSIIRASGFLHCLAPASPECRCPPCRPPGTRHSGKGRRNVQREQCGKGSREGWSHSRICLWTPLHGLPRLDRVGEHAETLAGGSAQSVGAAAPGQFHQSPGVSGIPRASPACGRLGADKVNNTALGQCEGSRAFSSSGIFSPAASVLPPVSAAIGTCRAQPREATGEGCGGEGLSECL